MPSRLILKSVLIRNFASIQNAYLEFPERGLVLVNGSNLTGSGLFKSVGSGKTALGEAITRTLLGVPGRFANLGKFSYQKAGNTYVQVKASLDGKPLSVELGYRCAELSKTGEGLRFQLGDDPPIQRAKIKDTREELDLALGMTAEVAGWTVFIDGSKLDFNRLGEGYAVNLLMAALNQPPWTEFYQKALKFKRDLKNEAETYLQTLEDSKQDLAEAEKSLVTAKLDLQRTEEAYIRAQESQVARNVGRQERINAITAQVETNKASLASLQAKIQEAESAEAAAYHQKDLERLRAESTLAEASKAYDLAVAKQGEAKVVVAKLTAEKEALTKALGVKQQASDADFFRTRNEEVASLKQAVAEAESSEKIAAMEAKSSRLSETTARDKVEAQRQACHQKVQRARAQRLEVADAVVSSRLTSQTKAKHAYERAADAVTREAAVPTTCPLAGCGKTWPRQNQAALDIAQSQLVTKKIELDQSEANLETAKVAAKSAQDEQVPEIAPVSEADQQWLNELSLSVKAIEERHAERVGAAKAAKIKLQIKLDEQAGESPRIDRSEESRLAINLVVAETAVSSADAKVAYARREKEMAHGDVSIATYELAKLKQASAVAGLSLRFEALSKSNATLIEEGRQTELAAERDILDTKPVDRAKIQAEERQTAVTRWQERVAKVALDYTDSVASGKVADYVAEAYSPSGIPNMIIQESVAPLNDISRRICHAMTGGLINVVYSTNRQLGSGRDVAELNIQLTNKFGSSDVEGSSKGEAGITDLIVAETIAEIGNVASRIGMRWYDEVARSQDPVVRSSIFSYLKELARRLGILIFVVDHATEVASYADYVISAEKSNSGTIYRID